MTLDIKIINNSNNPLPEYKTSESAGMDLYAFIQHEEDIKIISPEKTETISTGIYIKIPKGYEGQVRSRSGMATNNGIFVLNSPGTIDSDYIGEIKVILHNTSDIPFVVTNGQRIAQLVINKIEKTNWQLVESLEETERGEDGFGSTGNFDTQLKDLLEGMGIKMPTEDDLYELEKELSLLD